MSSAGHVLDMLNRMRQNRALRDKLHNRHNRSLDRMNKLPAKRKRFRERELSQEEKEAVRSRVKNRMSKEKRINLLKTIASLAISMLLSWLIFEYILKDIL